MKHSELWKIFTDRNPSFLTPGGQVTLSTAGLKKLFDQTYDAGFERGKAAANALYDPLANLERTVFGKGKR